MLKKLEEQNFVSTGKRYIVATGEWCHPAYGSRIALAK